MGSAKDLDTTKAEFKAALGSSEGQHHAFAAGGGLQGIEPLNIRDDDDDKSPDDK